MVAETLKIVVEALAAKVAAVAVEVAIVALASKPKQEIAAGNETETCRI